MGCGNVCVHGEYEGLYYVDYDYIHMYSSKDDPEKDEIYGAEVDDFDAWEYDDILSQRNFGDFQETFIVDFLNRFKSFKRSKLHTWLDNTCWAIMENDLFYIALEDNDWSVAVKLIQKDDPYGLSLEGLQMRHYQNYLQGIRDCLFRQFEELGVYGGPWTHGRIFRKEEIESWWAHASL